MEWLSKDATRIHLGGIEKTLSTKTYSYRILVILFKTTVVLAGVREQHFTK